VPAVRHRQATLVDLDHLVVERLDDRIDQDGQRDRRLVRVPRVVVDLDDRHPDRLVHLVGGDAGAVGVAHRVDEVVDQPLQLRRCELRGRDRTGLPAQHGMTDRGDLADRLRPMMPDGPRHNFVRGVAARRIVMSPKALRARTWSASSAGSGRSAASRSECTVP
jgi:hypothetical protein